jgi:hypothetical protein
MGNGRASWCYEMFERKKKKITLSRVSAKDVRLKVEPLALGHLRLEVSQETGRDFVSWREVLDIFRPGHFQFDANNVYRGK